jgi:hypothetical protein
VIPPFGLLEGTYGNKTGGHRLRKLNETDTTQGDRPFREKTWTGDIKVMLFQFGFGYAWISYDGGEDSKSINIIYLYAKATLI